MNFIEPLHQHAAERPDAHAVITPKGHLSWGRLDHLIWSTARKFHQSGIRESDRVGITTIGPLNHLISSAALTRIGATQIALPATDSAEVRREIQRELGLIRVVCDHEQFMRTPDSMLIPKLEILERAAQARDEIRSDRADIPWLILQSSGTTGTPKFAELTHQAARERLERYRLLFNCGPDDSFWAASRLDFVAAKQRSFFNLLSGAALCLPIGMTMSHRLVQFLDQHGVTIACGTPSHMHQLIEVGLPLEKLRVFEATSAVINERLRQSFRSRISAALHVTYGANESWTLTMANPELLGLIPDTVGRPTHPIELQIVDPTGALLPIGQTGEIRVRGPGVIGAYINHPEASARSFRGGWFHPGDLGFLTDSGALQLQGRGDDMMIFDGMNIYPAEIERVLSTHPAVREVAAFSLSHRRFQDVPAAAVRLDTRISDAALISYCQARMGIRHPRRILILDDFPRNAMGKVLKRELRQLANAGGL